LLEKIFKKYRIKAFPINRKILINSYGQIRGEKIAELLIKKGFEHNPYISEFEKSRKFFEIFVHLAIVVLFKLKGIIKYKSDRDKSYRIKEFNRYQSYIQSLINGSPCLKIPKIL